MKKSTYIQDLISQGEHHKLDFKFEISDARKIARTFVAFANSEGGKLLIGVKDNREIAGIRSEEEKFMAEEAVNKFSRPLINYTSKEWTINRKVILEINIPPGENGPYYAKATEDRWMIYIRVKDQNILANKILAKALRQKSSDTGTYINYSDNERLLLEFLEKNEHVTFTGFRKMAKISPYQAERILINFLALDIIQTTVVDNQFIYMLSEKFATE
mgnify:CR=1 FL=1